MLNYGAQRWDNEDGSYKLTMALQFPREEFSNEDTTQLLNTMKEFEAQVKADAVKNSKEWFGKVKSKEVILIMKLFENCLKSFEIQIYPSRAP